MHYAAEQGHIECLKLLVRAGGRCDIKDTNGKTSLDLATPGGRKILEKLSKFCSLLLFTSMQSTFRLFIRSQSRNIVKTAFEDKWLPDTCKLTIDMNIWDHKIHLY